jgi:hypothetical protein
MMRLLALLAGLIALAAAATPAGASWAGGEDLITSGSNRVAWPMPVMTANGDAIAAWSENDGVAERWKLGTWPLGAASTKEDFAPGAGTAVSLQTGGGAAVAAYAGDSTYDVHWRERPLGGSFGSLQTLDLTGDEIASNHLAVAMNVHGDIAFVWAGTAIYAAVKPAGGSFSAPVKLGIGAFPMDLKAQLSDSGELVAAWTNDTGVHAARRSADGHASSEQTMSGPDGDPAIDALAMDADGRALLVWRATHSTGRTGRLAVRGPGQDFSESAFPGPGLGNGAASAATMSAAGLVTIAYRALNGTAVYSGQFGAALSRVHTFPSVNSDVALATSRSGRTVIAIDRDYGHRLTAQRDGSGAFGQLEDLQPDCRNQSNPALGIDDAGHMVATWADYPSTSAFLTRGDGGAGHQGCLPSEYYSPDDAGNPPPRGGSPGPGFWGPVGSLPPGPLLDLKFGQPTLTGKGSTRTLKLNGACGERCYAYGSALVLRPNGRVIQKIPASADGGAEGNLAFRTPIALSSKARSKLKGTPLEIELRLYVIDGWSRGVVRSFTVRGNTVSASRARVRRCARARCRRTA